MKEGIYLKFLMSNKLILIVIIAVPIILSFSFGEMVMSNYTSYEGETYTEMIGLPQQDGGQTYSPEKVYKEKFNKPFIEDKINQIDKLRFKSSYYSSIINIGRASIFFGSIIAVLTCGRMVTDKSIIYHIINKESRKKAFLDFLFIPFIFILFVGTVTALSISTTSHQIFSEKVLTIQNSLLLPILILYLSLIEGYLIGIMFSLISNSEMVSILLALGLVFSSLLKVDVTKVILPYYYLITSQLGISELKRPDLILIGIIVLFILLIGNYLIFMRRDFY